MRAPIGTDAIRISNSILQRGCFDATLRPHSLKANQFPLLCNLIQEYL